MYPHSDRYRSKIVESGHMAIGGVELLDPDTEAVVRDLTISDGSVTDDATAGVRRRLDVTVVDDGGILPLGLGSPLFPGALLRPWRGLRYPDGTSERIPLGVLISGRPDADLTSRTVSLQADDRSGPIAAAQLLDPWPVDAGSSLAEVVTALLADRLPGCPAVALATTDVTIPADTFLEGDPWAALTSTSTDTPGLVHACGRRLWFDADGVPTLYPLTALDPVLTVDSSRLHFGQRTAISADDTYGGVCVRSDIFGDGDPLQSVLYDPSPLSPVWSRKVFIAQMDALDNQDDIDAAAGALLAQKTGVLGLASWDMPPDATIQAGDVLDLTGGDLAGRFELANVVTPLVTGAASVDTVERVLT